LTLYGDQAPIDHRISAEAPPPNTVFQPTRCASLDPQDRWHFDASTDVSMLYPRSERLNADRWALALK